MAGEGEPLIEAATTLVRACADEIDLSEQTGVHPRMGSLDVLPFVPLEGATLENAARLAHAAGKRIGELGFAVYLYETAATAPHRKNLADVRRGGYKGVAERIQEPDWMPDYGPAKLSPQLGAVAVGARSFLIAFNAYLDTGDVSIARENRRQNPRARWWVAGPQSSRSRSRREGTGFYEPDGSGKKLLFQKPWKLCARKLPNTRLMWNLRSWSAFCHLRL